MKPWKAARNAGQSARNNQLKQRTNAGHGYSAGYTEDMFEDGKCFFCRQPKGKTRGRRVAMLPVSGRIIVCADCRDAGKLDKERIFENTL